MTTMRFLRALLMFYFFGGALTSVVILVTYLEAREEGMPPDGGLTWLEFLTAVLLWPWILLLYFVD